MHSGLVFDDVVVERGGRRALDHLSCEVPIVGVTAVMGASGAGKSTFLRVCNRLEAPVQGRVLLDGRDLSSVDPLALRREIGMVFQRPTPFPGSVAENLRVGAPALTDTQVAGLLVRVGLDGSFISRRARELSGGEAQRMCLARALAAGPRLLLLDEPTSALDEESVKAVEEAVADIATEGVGALWVSHDAAQVARVAERVVRLVDGRCAGVDRVGEEPR